jgi:uncharacterized protein
MNIYVAKSHKNIIYGGEVRRDLYNNLKEWKKSVHRMPLLLQGARQVGKSYLIEKFGKNEFKNSYVFNFEQNPNFGKIFQQDMHPERILRDLSLVVGKTIKPETDLLFLDEIQECPQALTSLKYFNEKVPGLAICSAGSLLGVAMSAESFPVGKVEFMNLHPMTFKEFLTALDEKMLLEIVSSYTPGNPIPEIAHDMLWEFLKEYFFTGGMPQVVSAYLGIRENRPAAMRRVRKLQKALIESYYKDFAKHSGKINSMHIVSVFENIPMQLAKTMDGSVKRYTFKNVIAKKKGFAELDGPITWLERAGLINKVKVCNRAELPLEMFCKKNMFKLFVFDTGLLGCMLDLPLTAIFDDNYGISKGYVVENFVAQELIAAGTEKLYSWTERNSEIEFLKTDEGGIVPIEVKAGIRTRAKSLQQYIIKYSPGKALILSKKPSGQKSGSPVVNIPLYMAGDMIKE